MKGVVSECLPWLEQELQGCQPISWLFVDKCDSSATEKHNSQAVCQHRIAVTLFVKGNLCKGKKKERKGTKKEISVLGGSVSVLVDSNSEAALPCGTWHSSA